MLRSLIACVVLIGLAGQVSGQTPKKADSKSESKTEKPDGWGAWAQGVEARFKEIENLRVQLTELGEIIQEEISKNQDDIANLKSQVVYLKDQLKERPKETEFPTKTWGMWMLAVAVGIFIVSCVRLWADLNVMSKAGLLKSPVIE